MIENLLKLGGGGRAMPRGEVGLAADVRRVERRQISKELNETVFERRLRGLKNRYSFGRVLTVQRQLSTHRRQPDRRDLRILSGWRLTDLSAS